MEIHLNNRSVLFSTLPLKDKRIPWVLMMLYCLLGWSAVWSGHFLHDEGKLAWLFAAGTWHDFPAFIFFQKSRPFISFFFAPIAALGFPFYLGAHVFISSLAIPLIATISRKLDHPNPPCVRKVVG